MKKFLNNVQQHHMNFGDSKKAKKKFSRKKCLKLKTLKGEKTFFGEKNSP